jgi:hypothetical protein
MAGDRKCSDNGTTYYATKVFRIEHNIVGVAGDAHRTNKFLAWVRAGQPKDAPSIMDGDAPEFRALLLNRNGLFIYTDTVEPDKLHNAFHAIGTGADNAISVMHGPVNFSPDEAVKHAARIDENTGGKIDVLWVKDL